MKEKIIESCLFLLDEKIKSLHVSIAGLLSDANNETKSSAGDKHETSRAMMQAEQEKLYNQLKEAAEQKNELRKTGNAAPSEKISKGSLITTNHGLFFISIPFGKINIAGTEAFVISPQSPLGIKFMGLKEGDSTDVNGKKYSIQKIE